MERKLCNNCLNDMILRRGYYGTFWWCSDYPVCKFTITKLEENKDFLAKYWHNKWDNVEDIEWLNFIDSHKSKKKYIYQIWIVYIFYFKHQNFYKIWYSIDYKDRLKSLAIEHKIPNHIEEDPYRNPLDNIVIIQLLETYNFETLEKQLHFLFKDKLVYKKEYFNLNKIDLERISCIKSICGINIEHLIN